MSLCRYLVTASIVMLLASRAIDASASSAESSIAINKDSSNNSGGRRGDKSQPVDHIHMDPRSSSSSSPSSPSTAYYERIVFSDVDGTLVHYPSHHRRRRADDAADESVIINLPPSKTGARGVISARTLSLCHRLRHGNDGGGGGGGGRIMNGGVPFVLVSGMRTTTLFQRLPYLPRADAYVSESGGRIFYPSPVIPKSEEEGGDDDESDGGNDVAMAVDSEGNNGSSVEGLVVRPVSYPDMPPSDAVPFGLVEDAHWRDLMSGRNSAGPDGYDDNIPIERRRGRLWESARSLSGRGYVLDADGYATSFRINRRQQTDDGSISGFDAFVAADRADGVGGRDDGTMTIFDDLGCSTNLGCVDVYPAMSGKRNCAEYLLRKFLGGGGGEEEEEEEEEEGAGEYREGEAGDGRRSVSLKTHAYCMCDDDNDIEMAVACRAAYLPSVTSESMRALAANDDGDGNYSLVVVEDASKGIVESLATEAALEAIIEELSTDH